MTMLLCWTWYGIRITGDGRLGGCAGCEGVELLLCVVEQVTRQQDCVFTVNKMEGSYVSAREIKR